MVLQTDDGFITQPLARFPVVPTTCVAVNRSKIHLQVKLTLRFGDLDCGDIGGRTLGRTGDSKMEFNAK